MNIPDVVRNLAQGGATIEVAHELLRTLSNSNGCVPNLDWALKEADAIYASRGKRNIAAEVGEYVQTTSGFFLANEIDRDLQIFTTNEKHARRTALYQLVKDGVLERHKSKDGMFRRKERGLEIIDWQNADLRELEIEWPFGLEQWEVTYPGTLDVIAGSSGAGKTAYMMDFLRRNQDSNVCRYVSSEMSPQQMRHRLSKFGDVEWNFEAVKASSKFADLVLSDSITIIDYLEVDGENPSGVVNEIREIFDALKTGMVLVGLQKKGNTRAYKKDGSSYQIRNELGRGGAFSMEKARLYLSMDYNELTVVKASNRRDDDAPTLKGRRWGFSLYKGCIFESVGELSGEEE
jgi:hypothetical protein